MAIAGNLQTMQLAELLQWLSQGQKTGTLVIEHGAIEKRVFFRDGRIIASASTDPQEYLGEFLVRHGHIEVEALNAAVRRQEETGMLLGKLLVTTGALAEGDLQPLLEVKTRESLYDLFTWPEGRFEFFDDQLPDKEMIPSRLEVTGIVLEAVRRLDEWGRIREAVPTLDAVPVVVKSVDDAKATAAERRVLAEIDDRSTVREIRDRAHTTDFIACEAIFRAVHKGRVKVVVPPWVAGGRDASRGGTDAGGAAAGGEVDAAVLISAARPHLEAGRFEEALRRLRAARALAPDDREVVRAVDEGEAHIQRALETAGVVPSAVPRLTVRLEELTASKLSRAEGFLLSRITGSYDIAAILKISSLPPLEALLAFHRLVTAGHVVLDRP
ncbi:MAG TPA: DUF4388 domain-containing protein [Thermoanaerobaculia bacterium]|nr:DUF4388 domain-containing protein [Thermoanaerobaculia bacterium]